MRAPESLDLPFAVPAALRGHRTVIAATVGAVQVLVTRSPRGEVFWSLDGRVTPVAASEVPFAREAVATYVGDHANRVHYVCGGLI